MTRQEMSATIRRTARHNKDIPVKVNRGLPWVEMGNEAGGIYFMQGEEAENFLNEMEVIVQRFKVDLEEAIRYTYAKDYAYSNT